MAFKFGLVSKYRLRGVHPDLVKVMELAISKSPVDFSVIEGLRTIERQRQYVKSGASRTMKSRHLTGHAVDIAPYVSGKIRWDWPLYYKIAPIVKAAAKELKIPIVWGGDWKTFKDGPHFELDRKVYP
jgi:peptidoglycan L-alanyl-D-glutamate endopeptidase CwlK